MLVNALASKCRAAGLVLLLGAVLAGCGGNPESRDGKAASGADESLMRVTDQAAPESSAVAPDSATAAAPSALGGEGSTAPIPLDKTRPDCPGPSGHGSVQVQVTIDETGKVTAAEVAKSDLPESFEKAAVEAARQWTWRPGRDRNGVPVVSTVIIPFSFLCD